VRAKASVAKSNPDYFTLYLSATGLLPIQEVSEGDIRNARVPSTERGLLVDGRLPWRLPFPIPSRATKCYEPANCLQIGSGIRLCFVPTAGLSTPTQCDRLRQQTFEKCLTTGGPDDRNPEMYAGCSLLTVYHQARRAGEVNRLATFLDPIDQPRRAWSFLPGHRRTTAPEFAFDTPSPVRAASR